MAVWDAGKCGYCGHTVADNPRYTCPKCKRTGCADCMPMGEAEPCSQCKATAEYLERRGLKGVMPGF